MKKGSFLNSYGFLICMLIGIVAGCIVGAIWPATKDASGEILVKGATVLEPLGTVFLNLMFCMMLPFLGVFMPVIWMYSFFDSFNLRRQLRTGNFPMDDYPFHLEQDQTLARLLHARHRLVGWVLVAIGAYALYENCFSYMLWDLLDALPQLMFLRGLMNNLPSVVVAVALILGGLHLVRGKKEPLPPADEDYQDYGDQK